MKKLRTRVSELVLVSILIVMIFVDTVAALLDWIFHTRLRKPKITVEEIEHLVETNLPIGSSHTDILAFMEHHKIRHSDEVDTMVYYDAYPLAPKIEAKKDVIKKLMWGQIENVGRYLMVRADIRLMFYLDDQEKLVEYTVGEDLTGL